MLVIQGFHDSNGCFGANTGAAARRLLAERQWTATDYQECARRLRERLTVYEGEAGFFPPSS